MAKATPGKSAVKRQASFEAKLGASLERNPTHAPVAASPLPSAEAAAPERQITRVFMEFLPADEDQVRRITKFLVNHERMGVNRMRVVRLALRTLAESPETLQNFDAVLRADGRTRASRQKRGRPEAGAAATP